SAAILEDTERWVPHIAPRCQVEAAADTDLVAQGLHSSPAPARSLAGRVSRAALVVAAADRANKAVRVAVAAGRGNKAVAESVIQGTRNRSWISSIAPG